MSGTAIWPWVAMVSLGAWHGLNPGMGWLFAAALGLQEGRGSAAWRALPPLALGHAIAVGVVVALVLALGAALPVGMIRWITGALLIVYGALRLIRSRHPHYGGMRVGPRELTIWSFLMATAHGAGLMVAPFLLGSRGRGRVEGLPDLHAAHAHPGAHGLPGRQAGAAGVGAETSGVTELASDPLTILSPAAAQPEGLDALAAVLVHTGAYLAVTGVLAVVVVRWLGLRLLRSLWIDLDRVWAGALILTGLLTLLV